MSRRTWGEDWIGGRGSGERESKTRGRERETEGITGSVGVGGEDM